MIRLLVDEDLPRSSCRSLRAAGFECTDVRDVGLRGASDIQILDYAARNGCVLVTGDLGFVRLVRLYSPHPKGLVIVRLPNHMSTVSMNRRLVQALATVRDRLIQHIVVVEPDRVRIRSLN